MSGLALRGATALVTGASSGIGAALARQLAARGAHLILVARRQDRLDELGAALRSTCGVQVDIVAADLSAPAGLDAVVAAVGARVVDVLINNAGAGWIGLFADAPPARQLEIVDVNCRAVVGLTRAVLPGMLARRRGHVVQVASVAGFMPGPRSSVYYASKAFVVSHAEALRHELKGTGVAVTVVAPGPVATEFQRRAGVTGTMGGAALMSDVDVAAATLDAVEGGAFLVVPGVGNALLVALAWLLPRRFAAALVDRLQRKRLAAPPAD
ncbi:MAG: SDR family oxidoreductase [Deltaproteobacteria bacterium]|nr:SDR family oxidoreductase [Deltaproteobacteria bacterium]